MPAPSATALAPIVLWLAALIVDVWIYGDARAQQRRGTPVVFSAGAFHMDTPTAWFICCFVLWLFFIPLYLLQRGQRAR